MIPVNKDDKPSAPAPAHPAEPRDAATVVVLRDSGVKGLEVYLIKRSRMMDFMAGAMRICRSALRSYHFVERW